ncbi:MAG: hypothetical protein KAR47_12650, partial [Planctomycetes bacterium]|nr:hypothetical protein [Planctomycetota bacterium]
NSSLLASTTSSLRRVLDRTHTSCSLLFRQINVFSLQLGISHITLYILAQLHHWASFLIEYQICLANSSFKALFGVE